MIKPLATLTFCDIDDFTDEQLSNDTHASTSAPEQNSAEDHMYYRAKYKNFSQKEKTKEWNRKNYFKLSGGTLEVAMVSSNLIELPSESELVSALCQVTVSAGAKVLVGLSHCMKLSATTMCHISMVVGQRDGREAVQLTYTAKMLHFSTTRTMLLWSCLLEKTQPSMLLVLLSVQSPSQTQAPGVVSSAPVILCVSMNTYVVYFEQRRQDSDINYNMYWRVPLLYQRMWSEGKIAYCFCSMPYCYTNSLLPGEAAG